MITHTTREATSGDFLPNMYSGKRIIDPTTNIKNGYKKPFQNDCWKIRALQSPWIRQISNIIPHAIGKPCFLSLLPSVLINAYKFFPSSKWQWRTCSILYECSVGRWYRVQVNSIYCNNNDLKILGQDIKTRRHLLWITSQWALHFAAPRIAFIAPSAWIRTTLSVSCFDIFFNFSKQ